MRLIATVTRIEEVGNDPGRPKHRQVRHTKSFHHDASLAEVIDWARRHYWLANLRGWPRVPLELTVDESAPSPLPTFDDEGSADGTVVRAKGRRVECAPDELNKVKPRREQAKTGGDG